MIGVGARIGDYTVEEVIGRGGMGVVYRASRTEAGDVVALKLLSVELSSDEHFRERFRREAKLQAAIEHPNIVPVYEASESPEGLYIAMKLVPGPNLKQLIHADELDLARAFRVLRGVAAALDTAHEGRVIHRDVKPANILILEDHAYLADFGLTKAVGVDSVESLTRSGWLLGTLDYMAPEQIRGEDADPRSDIYSLAAVLFECLTGVVPFRRGTEIAVMYAHLEQLPPSVSSIRGGLPEEIDPVIRRGMAKHPDDRQQTATRLIVEAGVALFGRAAALGAPQPPLEHATTRIARGSRSVGRIGVSLAADPPTAAAPQIALNPAAAVNTAWTWQARFAAVAAVVLAIAAGLIAGEASAGGSPRPHRTRQITAAGAGLSVPRDWTPSGPRNAIQDVFGNRATHPAVAGASPRRFQDAGVLIGRTKAFGPELLAGSILSGTKVLRGGVPVRLGPFESLLYDDLLSNDGRRRIELFVVPTSRGIVTVACYAPVGSADTGALEQCGIVAETLQISAGSPFRLGARPEYERFLNSILRTLLTREQTALTDLRSATTRSGQHAAAMALADAYSAAAASFSVPPLGTLSPAEGGIHFLIRDSLLRVRDAYRQLAAAGATGRRKQFRAAKRGVLTAVNQLGAGLDELTKLGFVMS